MLAASFTKSSIRFLAVVTIYELVQISKRKINTNTKFQLCLNMIKKIYNTTRQELSTSLWSTKSILTMVARNYVGQLVLPICRELVGELRDPGTATAYDEDQVLLLSAEY